MASLKAGHGSAQQQPKAGRSDEQPSVVYNTRQTAPPLKNVSAVAKDEGKRDSPKKEPNASSSYANRSHFRTTQVSAGRQPRVAA